MVSMDFKKLLDIGRGNESSDLNLLSAAKKKRKVPKVIAVNSPKTGGSKSDEQDRSESGPLAIATTSLTFDSRNDSMCETASASTNSRNRSQHKKETTREKEEAEVVTVTRRVRLPSIAFHKEDDSTTHTSMSRSASVASLSLMPYDSNRSSFNDYSTTQFLEGGDLDDLALMDRVALKIQDACPFTTKVDDGTLSLNSIAEDRSVALETQPSLREREKRDAAPLQAASLLTRREPDNLVPSFAKKLMSPIQTFAPPPSQETRLEISDKTPTASNKSACIPTKEWSAVHGKGPRFVPEFDFVPEEEGEEVDLGDFVRSETQICPKCSHELVHQCRKATPNKTSTSNQRKNMVDAVALKGCVDDAAQNTNKAPGSTSFTGFLTDVLLSGTFMMPSLSGGEPEQKSANATSQTNGNLLALPQSEEKDKHVPPYCAECKAYIVSESIDEDVREEMLANLSEWMGSVSSLDENDMHVTDHALSGMTTGENKMYYCSRPLEGSILVVLDEDDAGNGVSKATEQRETGDSNNDATSTSELVTKASHSRRNLVASGKTVSHERRALDPKHAVHSTRHQSVDVSTMDVAMDIAEYQGRLFQIGSAENEEVLSFGKNEVLANKAEREDNSAKHQLQGKESHRQYESSSHSERQNKAKGEAAHGVGKSRSNDDTIRTDNEEAEMIASYPLKREIATKVIGSKLVNGYSLTSVQCKICEMPMMERDNEYKCVVCPVIKRKAKKAAKKKREEKTPSRSLVSAEGTRGKGKEQDTLTEKVVGSYDGENDKKQNLQLEQVGLSYEAHHKPGQEETARDEAELTFARWATRDDQPHEERPLTGAFEKDHNILPGEGCLSYATLHNEEAGGATKCDALPYGLTASISEEGARMIALEEGVIEAPAFEGAGYIATEDIEHREQHGNIQFFQRHEAPCNHETTSQYHEPRHRNEITSHAEVHARMLPSESVCGQNVLEPEPTYDLLASPKTQRNEYTAMGSNGEYGVAMNLVEATDYQQKDQEYSGVNQQVDLDSIIEDSVTPFFNDIDHASKKLLQGWSLLEGNTSCASCGGPTMSEPHLTTGHCFNKSCKQFERACFVDESETDFADFEDDPEVIALQKMLLSEPTEAHETMSDWEDEDSPSIKEMQRRADSLIRFTPQANSGITGHGTQGDKSNASIYSSNRQPRAAEENSFLHFSFEDQIPAREEAKHRPPPRHEIINCDDSSSSCSSLSFAGKNPARGALSISTRGSDVAKGKPRQSMRSPHGYSPKWNQDLRKHLDDSHYKYNKSPMSHGSRTAITTKSSTVIESLKSDSSDDDLGALVQKMHAAKRRLLSRVQGDSDNVADDIEAQLDMAMLIQRLASAAKEVDELDECVREIDSIS